MIDHFGIKVKDFTKSKDFYQKVLQPLGYQLAANFPQAASFVEPNDCDPMGDFWLNQGKAEPQYIAFHADTHAQVDAFYQAGLAAGAKSNGESGLRENYHPNYYAAYLIDPDGNNIEAVCHKEIH